MILLALGAVQAGHPDGPVRLSLKRALSEALSASPRLQAPADAVALAEIRRTQASARFGTKLVPTFSSGSEPGGFEQRNLGLGVTKRLPFGTDVQASVSSLQYGTGPSSFRDAGYSIGFSQPLLRGFGQTDALELANSTRSVSAAGRARVDARQQLVIAVADTYLGVVRTRRLVEAGERAVERASKLHEASEARAKVGLATELDVLRAALLRSQARSMLAQNRESLETSLDDLKTLIGRGLDEDVEVDDLDLSDEQLASLGLAPAIPDGGQDDVTVTRLIADAIAARPDVREAHDRIGDARRAERVARWNLLPPLTLNAAYTRSGFGSPSADIFGSLMSGWRFGVSTSYALDHADEQAAAATASISVGAAEREAVDTDRRVAAEVRRAYRAWQRTADTIDIQAAAVTLAGKQKRVAELRYERGLAGNFDIVDAENNLFQAESALIAARVDRTLAGLTLRRVSGHLEPDELVR